MMLTTVTLVGILTQLKEEEVFIRPSRDTAAKDVGGRIIGKLGNMKAKTKIEGGRPSYIPY